MAYFYQRLCGDSSTGECMEDVFFVYFISSGIESDCHCAFLKYIFLFGLLLYRRASQGTFILRIFDEELVYGYSSLSTGRSWIFSVLSSVSIFSDSPTSALPIFDDSLRYIQRSRLSEISRTGLKLKFRIVLRNSFQSVYR
jgi:hypothetical protein